MSFFSSGSFFYECTGLQFGQRATSLANRQGYSFPRLLKEVDKKALR